MTRFKLAWLLAPGLCLLGTTFLFAAAGCDSGSGSAGRVAGQTDFEGVAGGGVGPGLGARDSAGTTGGAPTAPGAATPPSGRTGPVQEADIYRIDQNRLFYLNTYRGFLIYDINDPQNPRQVSRLPVFGYPVEMFVQGNTVYALLSDVLYLSESKGPANGNLHFERRDVSQLVSIDVSDLAHPRVLKTVDIVGQLREGVSRKIENTVYVVSYIPQAYYWGWRYELPSDPQKEQAWVYSFNVADPTNLQLVQRLKIFEGGSISDTDPVTGGQVTRSFSNVALSATSNALMVVENWYLSSWTPGPSNGMGVSTGCGSWAGDQRAVVSLVDISDPAGAIRLHAHFQTRGALEDQFKMTYVYDDAAATGTFYGIFARQAWDYTNCSSKSVTENALESWDVTNGGAPVRLDSLAFGKPNEIVRGTAYDVGRKAAYAITAQSIDPLYVLSFADRAHLAVRSSIDGLSGDMTLFRLVEGNNFLVGIGRDASETCSGFQGTETRRGIGVAVSLIDVRNLDAIRLVQRQCVAVDGDWVSSEVTWNLDQAHKMIGMQSDGSTNVVTIPVSYSKRVNDTSWWWYTWQTAVGILSWDLTKYDPALPPAQQNVIQNYGTFNHPNGEVRRTIVFNHDGATGTAAAEARRSRMLLNLSDTHISIADITDLANPVAQSVVEVAPYVSQIFRFGDYVVEAIPQSPYYWAPQQGLTEFRVKRGGGGADLEDAPVVARFSASQVQSVVPHGNQLVVFRMEQDATKTINDYLTHVLVFDLGDPVHPTLAGETTTTGYLSFYYPFLCGLDWGWGYWYGWGQNSWTATDDALVSLGYSYDSASNTSTPQITTIELADPTHPTVSRTKLASRSNGWYVSLVPDAADRAAFFLAAEDSIGITIDHGNQLTRVRDYVQRFHRPAAGSATAWEAEPPINVPGQLVRTWAVKPGQRAYLTSDWVNYSVPDAQGNLQWRFDTRLNLLTASMDASGRSVAELQDTRRFANQYVSDLVIEGNSLFVNASPTYSYYWYGPGVVGGGGVGVQRAALSSTATAPTLDEVSDRLMVFDLGGLSFRPLYDQATGTQGVRFMGTYQGRLFVNLQGDGILAIDVANPAKPVGRQFLRTLGWTTHIVFVGNDAYAAAGYFGVYRLGLTDPTSLPVLN